MPKLKPKPKPKPRPRTRTKPTQTTVNRHRQCGLPVGNRSIVPLLHIWLRLNHSSYSMRETRSHYRKRIRLEQRSLPQNICQFIAVYCSSFYRLFVSAPSSPLAAIDAKTKRDASVVVKQKNEPPGATASPRFLNRIFGSVSVKRSSKNSINRYIDCLFLDISYGRKITYCRCWFEPQI